MSAGRQLHEEGHLAKDTLAVAGLLEQLEQPVAEKGKGGNAPVKKAPNAPALQAAIDNAGGELQRGGAGGSMSFIGAMPVKKYVP
jgi:hypothetical protein